MTSIRAPNPSRPAPWRPDATVGGTLAAGGHDAVQVEGAENTAFYNDTTIYGGLAQTTGYAP